MTSDIYTYHFDVLEAVAWGIDMASSTGGMNKPGSVNQLILSFNLLGDRSISQYSVAPVHTANKVPINVWHKFKRSGQVSAVDHSGGFDCHRRLETTEMIIRWQ